MQWLELHQTTWFVSYYEENDIFTNLDKWHTFTHGNITFLVHKVHVVKNQRIPGWFSAFLGNALGT